MCRYSTSHAVLQPCVRLSFRSGWRSKALGVDLLSRDTHTHTDVRSNRHQAQRAKQHHGEEACRPSQGWCWGGWVGGVETTIGSTVKAWLEDHTGVMQGSHCSKAIDQRTVGVEVKRQADTRLKPRWFLSLSGDLLPRRTLKHKLQTEVLTIPHPPRCPSPSAKSSPSVCQLEP